MKHSLKKYLFFVLVIHFSNVLYGVKDPFFSLNKQPHSPIFRTRITVSPIVSFYTVNESHARDARQKMSGVFSLKEEIRLNEKHTAFLLIGVDYMVHGINFSSYYFKPDSLQLYNGKMNYNYSLYIHEIDIPIQIKYSFTRENNALFSPYLMVGYHFRTMIAGFLKVTQDGNQVERKMEDVKFKNGLFSTKNNAFVSFTFGVQKNNPNHTGICFCAEVSYRYGFSPYSISDTFAPSSLYMNGSHLSLGIGIKF